MTLKNSRQLESGQIYGMRLQGILLFGISFHSHFFLFQIDWDMLRFGQNALIDVDVIKDFFLFIWS